MAELQHPPPTQDPGQQEQQAEPAPPQEPPWHAALPAPTMTAPLMPAARVQMMLTLKIASLLIIDVRRTDYLGGAIRGSLNIPAQSFFWNRGILYELAYKAGMEWVVFTCQSSSDGGRGRRCAGWFKEWVDARKGEDEGGFGGMEVAVLEGGVKGWVKGGESRVALMDGFEAGHWERLFAEDKRKRLEAEKVGEAAER